ncbi:hypothetical protein LFWB_6360 [Candidatus Phytoplasma luffae]|uniref:Uncharacterized protein n=1 Tax=Loofah witches'-broom phytoplasma TaxID=35773 RepID=A0A975IMI3_LOWBP|nr:hypothetical protein LFWB_6360 [Candidatus Phytoplasma luffae]
MNKTENKSNFFNKIIIFIILILSWYTLYNGINLSFKNNSDNGRKLKGLGLLTRQNNFFVNIALLLYYIKSFRNSKYFSYFIFNCLINCFFIFFVTLFQDDKKYLCEHKLLPVIFCFYFCFIEHNLIYLNYMSIGFVYISVYIFFSILIYFFNKSLFAYLKEFNLFSKKLRYFNHVQIIFYFFLFFLYISIIWFLIIYCIFHSNKKYNLKKSLII